MQHYSKYKISSEGVVTILGTDLDFFEKKILSYKLTEEEDEGEIE